MGDGIDALLDELFAELGIPVVLDIIVSPTWELVSYYRPPALEKSLFDESHIIPCSFPRVYTRCMSMPLHMHAISCMVSCLKLRVFYMFALLQKGMQSYIYICNHIFKRRAKN